MVNSKREWEAKMIKKVDEIRNGRSEETKLYTKKLQIDRQKMTQ